MATLAQSAGDLAALLGVDLRDYTKTKVREALPTCKPCRCVGGAWVWTSAPDHCFRCGRYLDEAIGDVHPHSDADGWADLDLAVEVVRHGLLQEAIDGGVMDEGDYVEWLEARIAAAERSLERMAAA